LDNKYSAFAQLEKQYPLEQRIDPETYRPTMNGVDPASGMYTAPAAVQRAQYYNTERYMEPFVSTFFGSSVPVVEALEAPGLVPVIDRRIDPNKIFNSDIQALKTLAADQIRMKKLFEKKLQESLTEKGKIGLTEDDINAMQALTSAGTAIASINTAQVNIKKTITDIRLKQQMNSKETNGPNGNDGGRNSYDYNDVGRNMLDDLFRSAVNVNVNSYTSEYNEAETANPEMLDSILPKPGENIEVENMDGTVYVVANEDEKSAHYEAFASDGSRISDYPLPTAPIKDIDKDAEIAHDSLGREYKFKQVFTGTVE
jgi:hypothetical protein